MHVAFTKSAYASSEARVQGPSADLAVAGRMKNMSKLREISVFWRLPIQVIARRVVAATSFGVSSGERQRLK